MAATLWLAAVGTALTLSAKPLLWLALFIPVPFWYFDAQYHAYQERFGQRWRAVREFIREGTFKVPAGEASLDDFFSDHAQCVFPVPDYYGEKTFDFGKPKKPNKTTEQPKERASLIRNAFTKKMLFFYGAFAVASVVLIGFFSRLNLPPLRCK